MLTIDTSELEAATRQLAAALGKDVPKAINKKMGWLLRRWFWNMPQVPTTKIASQLGFRLRRSKSGTWRRSKLAASDSAPTIVKIIQSRGNSPFKGKTRKEGARAMREMVRKVAAARAKSSGYLRSGVVSALRPFLPFASGGKSATPPAGGQYKQIGNPKGFGFVAQSGPQPTATAIDRTTAKHRWSKKKPPEDDALRKHAKPALEKSYREELADTNAYLNKVLYESARKVGIAAKL